jgi:segregation and condensation protein A
MELNSETNKYKIKIENFEGPLDLLCHLIEKNKMNIYDISITEITDQYIGYINSMQDMNLEVTGDFLLMASNLLYMKSKILLPVEKKEEEESEEDLKEELISRIIEYKKLKEVTESLRLNNEKFSLFHYKTPEKITFPKEKPKLDAQYPSDLIPSVFMKLSTVNMNKINHRASDVNRLIESEKVTVKSKIKEILKGIIKNGNLVFNKVFNVKKKSKIEVITAFIAMLELNRASRVSIEQEYNFGDIKLKKM